MRWPRAAAALVLATIFAGASQAAAIRICDGRPRHVDCHFQGGGRLVIDLPADELLSYGPPTLSFTDKGAVHVVVQACEIVCHP